MGGRRSCAGRARRAPTDRPPPSLDLVAPSSKGVCHRVAPPHTRAGERASPTSPPLPPPPAPGVDLAPLPLRVPLWRGGVRAHACAGRHAPHPLCLWMPPPPTSLRVAPLPRRRRGFGLPVCAWAARPARGAAGREGGGARKRRGIPATDRCAHPPLPAQRRAVAAWQRLARRWGVLGRDRYRLPPSPPRTQPPPWSAPTTPPPYPTPHSPLRRPSPSVRHRVGADGSQRAASPFPSHSCTPLVLVLRSAHLPGAGRSPARRTPPPFWFSFFWVVALPAAQRRGTGAAGG